MKRFTETNKWSDPWFRRLPPNLKLFWFYICDACDSAGVIDLDMDAAEFAIGTKVDLDYLERFAGRLVKMENGKLRLLKFVQFQYGKLSRSCKPHMPVFAVLDRHGLNPDDVAQNETFRELVDDGLRARILARDGLRCVYFNTEISTADAVIDHIIPRRFGGKSVVENLVVASRSANAIKHDLSVSEFCKVAGLDLGGVLQRLSKATGKAIEPYHGRVKETEKEKEKEREGVQGEIPTEAEWVSECLRYSVPEWFASEKYWRQDKLGWANVRNWKSACREVSKWHVNAGRPLNPTAGREAPKPQRPDRFDDPTERRIDELLAKGNGG